MVVLQSPRKRKAKIQTIKRKNKEGGINVFPSKLTADGIGVEMVFAA